MGEELLQTSCKVAHFHSTTGPPVALAFRQLDREKLVAVKKEFLALEAMVVVEGGEMLYQSLGVLPAQGQEGRQFLVAPRGT